MKHEGVKAKAVQAEAVRAGAASAKAVRATAVLARAVKATGAALLSMAVLGCVGDPPPFDPRTFHRPERAGAGEGSRTQPKSPLPTTMESTPTTRPAAPTELEPNTLRLPLQEIVQRAVANNSEVRVAGYEPAIEETRQVEADARFDPSFFIGGSYDINRILSPGNTGQNVDPFNPTTFGQLTGQTGVRQNFFHGGTGEIVYRSSRIRRSPAGFGGLGDDPVNPYYLNELQVRITQPLLRDFGGEVNQARISIARNNQRVSLLEFRRTLEENIFEIERLYWQLVQAERELRIQEDLLERTIDTYKILYDRFTAGVDVARVQVSQAAASVESRRAVLVRARQNVANVSDQLKQRMNDPEFPVAGPTILLAANAPVEEGISFELVDQINTALENRLELGQQAIRIDSARITERVGKNNLLPQLNLQASVTFQGVGDDFGGALDSQNDFDHISSSIGLELEIPIGNRAARAIYKRTRLQRQQAVEQYRNLVERTSLEVVLALREIETTWREIGLLRQARFTQADALLAILQREEAGEALTPTFVQLKLDTQERLAQAEAQEAQAVSNYNIAIARLEQAKGTLLRYNNVLMEEESLAARNRAP